MTDTTASDGIAGVAGPGLAVNAYALLVQTAPNMYFSAIQDHPDVIAQLDKAGQDVAKTAIATLTGINTHLDTAKAHAATWQSQLVPSIYQALNDIEGYATEFAALMAPIQLAQWPAGTSPTAEQATAYLQAVSQSVPVLASVMGSRVQTAQALALSLASYVQALAADAAAFQTDGTNLNQVVSGDNGLVALLNQKVTALNDAITKDTAMIAGGAAAIVTGVLVCVIGGVLLASGVGAPAGIAIIGAGVAVAGGGIALTTVGGVDLAAKSAELVQTQSELSVLHASVAYFQTAATHVSSFASAAAAAAKGADQLHGMWANEQAKLNEVVLMASDALNAADQSGQTQITQATNASALLGATATMWQNALTLCGQISNAMSGVPQTNTVLFHAA